MEISPVVHFEMPAGDMKRMKEFYTKVFNWQMQQLGSEMGNYVVVTTTESDKNGRPKEPGTINGGFYMRTEDPRSHAPSVVIAVSDANAYMKKITDAGGKILRMPEQIPGFGLFTSFLDTEGNRITMLQPDQMK